MQWLIVPTLAYGIAVGQRPWVATDAADDAAAASHFAAMVAELRRFRRCDGAETQRLARVRLAQHD